MDGTYDWMKDSLDLTNGQFIDIQVPRWMVEAFWPPDPKPPPEVGVAEIVDAAYTTPYLELMQRAIAELGISAANQPKKTPLWNGSARMLTAPRSQKITSVTSQHSFACPIPKRVGIVSGRLHRPSARNLSSGCYRSAAKGDR